MVALVSASACSARHRRFLGLDRWRGLDAQCTEGVGRPPEQSGPLEPLHRSAVGQRGRCPRVVGYGRKHLDRQGPSDVGRRELGRSCRDDEKTAPSQLGGQARQRLPQVDDGLQRGWTEDHQGISTGQHLPHSSSEVGEQSAHIDHHIGVEGTKHIGDDRPGLLVGDGLMHAAQTEQHRETAGEVVDVVPDILRLEGATSGGEQRGETTGRGHGIAGGEVTAEGIGLDQKDPAALRPAGSQGGGRGGDPRRSLDRGEGDEGHLPAPDGTPSLTRESPI